MQDGKSSAPLCRSADSPGSILGGTYPQRHVLCHLGTHASMISDDIKNLNSVTIIHISHAAFTDNDHDLANVGNFGRTPKSAISLSENRHELEHLAWISRPHWLDPYLLVLGS